MHKYSDILITIILLIIRMLPAQAQQVNPIEEELDSIPCYTELDETVVQGMKTITKANKITVLPNKFELNGAIDGYDLVKRLNIPTIFVNRNSISTITGRDVSLFLNGIPATQDEIKDLNVKNITKVEYIDFPQDTKYFGASHIIDIITKEPEYGGFTKISPDLFYNNKGIITSDLSSKFVYKRMMYDFVGSQFFLETNKVGQSINQTIALKNALPFTQLQNIYNSYKRDESYKAFFRAVYSAPNVVISNKVGLVFKSTPKQFETILLSFPEQNDEFLNYSNSNSHTLSPSWVGNYNFTLPNNFSLSYNGDFTYSHNNYNSKKNTDNLLIYDNKVKEDVYRFSSAISGGKNFNKAGFLTLSAYYYNIYYNTKYNQNNINSIQTQKSQGLNPSVSYSIPLSNFMIQMQIGGQFLRNEAADIKTTAFTPHANLNGYWSRNRQSAQISLMMSEVNYGGSMMNPNLLQIDNLIYTKGNPELKVSPYYSVNWYYFFQLSNSLQVVTMGNCDYWHNTATIKYVPENDYIIQTRINSGNFYSGKASLRFIWRPLNNNLVIDATPTIMYSGVNGYNNQNVAFANIYTSVTYYLKKWNFNIYYSSDSKQTDNNGIVTHSPSVYGLSIGWGNENWNIVFNCSNPFRTSWEYTRQSYKSDVYSFNRIVLGEENSHNIFNFAFAYIISYGKKTSHETLKTSDTSSSAILH